MIYKAPGLPFGGRKAVLIGDPRAVETQRLLERAEKRDVGCHTGSRMALGKRHKEEKTSSSVQGPPGKRCQTVARRRVDV